MCCYPSGTSAKGGASIQEIARLGTDKGTRGKVLFKSRGCPFHSHSSVQASHVAEPEPGVFCRLSLWGGAAKSVNRNAIDTPPPLLVALWGAGAGRRESRESCLSVIGGLLCGHPVDDMCGSLRGCSASPRSAQRSSCVCSWCLIVVDTLTRQGVCRGAGAGTSLLAPVLLRVEPLRFFSLSSKENEGTEGGPGEPPSSPQAHCTSPFVPLFL